MKITPDIIRAVAPNVPQERADWIAPSLSAAAAEFGINTRLRVAHFLAQLAHESGGFRHREEIWGPTRAQKRYEGRDDLGNTEPGDGFRFRGRGWIQLTGRANYRTYGRKLGVALEADPDLARSDGNVMARIAACYWADRKINPWADRDSLVQVTKKINGGLNGYADRALYLRRAKKAVGL